MADSNPGVDALGSFLKWMIGQNANNNATDAATGGVNNAMNAINGGTDKAIALQQPYTQNAGADYNRMRGLVQSGYFQQPYGQSFTPQQAPQNGFSFNPKQGGASFAPRQSGGLMGFTPQGLPPQGQYAPGVYQPPQAPQAPQQPQQPQQDPQAAIKALIAKIMQQGTMLGPINNVSQAGSPLGAQYNPSTGQNSPNQQWAPGNPTIPQMTRIPTTSSGPYGLMGR